MGWPVRLENVARRASRRQIRRLLCAFVVLSVLLSLGPLLRASLGSAVAADPMQRAPVEGGLATAEPEDPVVPTADIGEDGELLVTGNASADGYLLEVASEESGWTPEPLAVLNTGPVETRAWVGYHCVTGNGRFAVAVVAPWEASNRPVLRNRRAVAFGVEVRTGEVTRLVDGVALKHFNPKCGDDRVGLVRHLGVDQEASEVLVVEPATGDVVVDEQLDGQIVGAVPSDDQVYVFRDRAVARLDDGAETDVVATGGQPYMLAASPNGVTFLAAEGDRARVRRLVDDNVSTLGSYQLGEVKLHGGLDGDVTAVVRDGAPGQEADGLRWVERSETQPMPDVVSTAASTTVESSTKPAAAPTERVVTSSGRVILERESTQVDMSLPADVLEYEVAQSAATTAANHTDPVCAVERNNPHLMATQASPDQIQWAVEQVVAGNTAFTWPSNHLNQGWPAYSPVADFPVEDLAGPTDSVPAQVAWATFAQESNWKQASRRSLPGASANPTIASYYGAPWDDPLSNIDYDDADCGYGLAQVTDGMRNDDGLRTVTEERKIALDYVANAAGGVQILAEKWNELYVDHGMQVNNGDAKYLENWYFALWAYNSGWNTPDGAGHSGLGWTNNPRNSDYPPDRNLFLRDDLDDSKHPSDWPYQERVFGWMENPLWNLGEPSDRHYPYPVWPGNSGAEVQLRTPDVNAFCTSANQCSPTHYDPGPGPVEGDQSYCMLSDRHCWWHWDVTFTDCADPGGCAQSEAPQVSNSEPEGGNNWPPNCNELPVEATGVPGTVLIDDVPAGTTNLEGCPPATTQGTFTKTFGETSTGMPLALIDWHQLGTGFRGHTWFTDNVEPDDVAHTTVGRWTPSDPLTGRYRVWAHIPAAGATSEGAIYTISTGFGTFKATIDQGYYEDQNNEWALLGMYDFYGEGSYVELTNANGEPAMTTDIAYDAMMFVPQLGGPQQSTTLIPRGAAWRYLDTGDIPDGWARDDFNHSTWQTGYAPLGAGMSNVRTSINRTNPGHITDLFRRTFEVDSADDVWGLNLSVRYDDAVAVWLNGELVYQAGLPSSPSPPVPGTLALTCREAPLQDTYETVSIPGWQQEIVEGTNVVAVELHQCASNPTDSAFDLSLTGVTAPTVEGVALDKAVGENTEHVNGLDLSFYPVAGASEYQLYELDYLDGEDATPTVNRVLPSNWPLDGRGKLVVSPLGFVSAPRVVLREYYIITRMQDGTVSLPSQALRVFLLPNATDADDNSGPNIAWGRIGVPTAPPGAVPLTAPALATEAVPAALPEVGQASTAVVGGETVGVGLVALAPIVFIVLPTLLAPDLETRLPTQVLHVPLVWDDPDVDPPTPAEVAALADVLQDRKIRTGTQLDRQTYELVARACLSVPAAVLGDADCETVPVFIPGYDDRAASLFYLTSITQTPVDTLLRRDSLTSVKAAVIPRRWYTMASHTDGQPCGASDPLSCDEYPFYSSINNIGFSPPVHLDPTIPNSENTHVGAVLSGMYNSCQITPATSPGQIDGDDFLVIPVPVPNVETTYICSAQAK